MKNGYSTKYFNALTGVRILAAYFVFLHHYKPFNGVNSNLSRFSDELHIGVTMFFVLSGFLIAHRYLHHPNFNYKEYLARRFARIYPMYFLLTTLTFLFLWAANSNESSWFLYLMNITFLKGFFSELKFSGLGQGWSLTVEEVFYFTAPLYFLFIKRSLKAIYIIPIVLIVLGLLIVWIFENMSFFGFFDSNNFMFGYTFLGRCVEFFVGIGLYIICRRFKGNVFNYKYFTYTGLIFITVFIYSISQFRESDILGIHSFYGQLINNLALPLFGISIFFYGLIYEKTLISKLLSSKFFILLGKSSYIFYLIHVGVITEYVSYKIDSLMLLFLLLNIVSVLLYMWVEQPINLWLRKLSKRLFFVS